jgi:hypothetical protein
LLERLASDKKPDVGGIAGCEIVIGDQMFEAQSDILIQVLGGSLPEDS